MSKFHTCIHSPDHYASLASNVSDMGGDRVNGGYIRKNQTSTCGRHPNNINGIKHTLGVSSSFARKDPKTKKDK